jgi:hypothetical protein
MNKKCCKIFLLFFIFLSCADNANLLNNGSIEPVFPDNNVIAFFEKHLPSISGLRSDCFILPENTCLMINNLEELRRRIINDNSIEVPVIDFKSYTLVVGQYVVPTTGYYVIEQHIAVGTEKHVLHIVVHKPEAAFAAISELYFWGLYPKLSTKPIDLNISFSTNNFN